MEHNRKKDLLKNSKRILVTGGTGFVGSYLLRYLDSLGYRHIRALRRRHSSMDLVEEVADRIEWVEGDVLDIIFLEEAMSGIDQVYHCAALVSFDPREASRMAMVNAEGTANVVNTALLTGIEKLVHVSSIAAIGRTREGEWLDEGQQWQRNRFQTRYALTKFLAEQEVWRARAEGLPASIVNPAVILGGGRWQDGPLQFFNLAWNNFPFYTTGTTGFVDVRDVARFMIRLMESDIEGERYILSAENLSYKEIMDLIAQGLDRRPPFIRFSAWLRELSWRLLWPGRLLGKTPVVTRETARLASQVFYFDNAKSRQDFDFQYLPISRTIEEVCQTYRIASHEGLPSKPLPLIPF